MEFELTAKVKREIAKKWGEGNPGVGGINYVQHEAQKALFKWMEDRYETLCNVKARNVDSPTWIPDGYLGINKQDRQTLLKYFGLEVNNE